MVDHANFIGQLVELLLWCTLHSVVKGRLFITSLGSLFFSGIHVPNAHRAVVRVEQSLTVLFLHNDREVEGLSLGRLRFRVESESSIFVVGGHKGRVAALLARERLNANHRISVVFAVFDLRQKVGELFTDVDDESSLKLFDKVGVSVWKHFNLDIDFNQTVRLIAVAHKNIV